ncbi:MAG: 30S ribosome-binding factor RbfA [Pyrinomonadaceae bacterium]|nr:30S ribosome-binding factor RbfA [Pyrinomonadaceae bacterium]
MRRPERIAETLREEISAIVGFELDDPRTLTVNVTEVKIADNLRDARVFVTAEGTEDEINAAMTALRYAAPSIRKQVAFALDLRHAPQLHFVRDTVEEQAVRVENLLAELKLQKRNDSDES